MNSGVFIPFQALPGFSPAFQAEFEQYVQSQMSAVVEDRDPRDDTSEMEEDEQFADLSIAQAKKFLERVSDKVRTAIRVIAEADPSGFDMDAVMHALDADDASALRGVWGGITKRVRTVLGDEEAYLIWWVEREGGWVGRLSSMTHRSFRKVLGL